MSRENNQILYVLCISTCATLLLQDQSCHYGLVSHTKLSTAWLGTVEMQVFEKYRSENFPVAAVPSI